MKPTLRKARVKLRDDAGPTENLGEESWYACIDGRWHNLRYLANSISVPVESLDFVDCKEADLCDLEKLNQHLRNKCLLQKSLIETLAELQAAVDEKIRAAYFEGFEDGECHNQTPEKWPPKEAAWSYYAAGAVMLRTEDDLQEQQQWEAKKANRMGSEGDCE